jgi:hypothetical protein
MRASAACRGFAGGWWSWLRPVGHDRELAWPAIAGTAAAVADPDLPDAGPRADQPGASIGTLSPVPVGESSARSTVSQAEASVLIKVAR